MTNRELLKRLREAFPRREWRMAFCDLRGDVVQSRHANAVDPKRRKWRRAFNSKHEAAEAVVAELRATAARGGER